MTSLFTEPEDETMQDENDEEVLTANDAAVAEMHELSMSLIKWVSDPVKIQQVF